jgi:hypothetical protein
MLQDFATRVFFKEGNNRLAKAPFLHPQKHLPVSSYNDQGQNFLFCFHNLKNMNVSEWIQITEVISPIECG